MAEISAIPQQPQLGRLAQFLRYLETEKPEFLPSQLDVMGLVRQLTLPQAATVENLSYGNLPFTMPPSGTGAMIPQVKTGRKPEVADLVGMLGGVPGGRAVMDVGTKLSNEAADAIVRTITRNPAATAPQVLQETAMPLSNITAWHGSPSLFSMFDPAKRGTGEGAQAYGVGAGYTGGERAVGESYKLQLSQNTEKIGNLSIADYYKNLENQAAKASGKQAQDLYAKMDLVEMLSFGKTVPEVKKYAQEAGYPKNILDWVDKELLPKFEPSGYLYKGDIPDEILPRFLDWDKPLTQQSEEVRNLLKRRITDVQPMDKFDMGGNARLRDNRNGQYDKTSSSPWLLETYDATGTKAFGLSQKDVDKMFGAKDAKDLTGQQIYARLTQEMGSQQAASDYLESIGLRGIRYLDQGSRQAGEGTSNFIPFRAEDYKIQEINDIPIEQYFQRGLLNRPMSPKEEAKAAWEANPDNRDLYEAYRKLRLTE